MASTRPDKATTGVMYAGLALSAIAALVPLLDRATGNLLAEHVRAGYPTFPPERIDTAVTTWLVYLSVVGAIGVLCWFLVIRVVRSGRWWGRLLATAVFILGLSVALFNLLVRDTSGDTGLPAALGWVGMVPALAGAVVVARLWTQPRQA